MIKVSNGPCAIPLWSGVQGCVLGFANYRIAETHPSPHTIQRAPSPEGNPLKTIYSKYQSNKSNGPARFPS